MTPESPRRRGRRDNGLDALCYVPLADVDPRIGEYLLDVLWAAGVPAYLEPSADLNAARALRTPSPPSDRLWVDRTRRSDARTIVESEAPGLPAAPEPGVHDLIAFTEAEQATWADLLTRLAEPDAPGSWPEAENIAPDTGTAHGAPDTGGGRPGHYGTADRRGFVLNSDPDTVMPGDYPDIEDEGHFDPPAPPPVPRPSKYTVGALACIALGILLLVAPTWLEIGGRAAFAAGVLAIVAGVAVLVWRLHEDHEPDDPDDGAIV